VHEYFVAAGFQPASKGRILPPEFRAPVKRRAIGSNVTAAGLEAWLTGRQDACRRQLSHRRRSDSRRLQQGIGFGIRAEKDGLPACGVPGVQLT
jgi:hypothetical protein